MSEYLQAFKDGDIDRAEELLVERFPDAPKKALAAVSALLFLKVNDVDEMKELEPRLGELVERVNEEWEAHGWT